MISEVPGRVVEIVQELLEQQGSEVKSRQKLESESISTITLTSTEETTKVEKEKKVVLKIWDFSGRPIYYTTHQVCIMLLFPYVGFTSCIYLRSQLM